MGIITPDGISLIYHLMTYFEWREKKGGSWPHSPCIHPLAIVTPTLTHPSPTWPAPPSHPHSPPSLPTASKWGWLLKRGPSLPNRLHMDAVFTNVDYVYYFQHKMIANIWNIHYTNYCLCIHRQWNGVSKMRGGGVIHSSHSFLKTKCKDFSWLFQGQISKFPGQVSMLKTNIQKFWKC